MSYNCTVRQKPRERPNKIVRSQFSTRKIMLIVFFTCNGAVWGEHKNHCVYSNIYISRNLHVQTYININNPECRIPMKI